MTPVLGSRLALAGTLLLAACRPGITETADGQYFVDCRSKLSECARQAEAHCRSRGGVHIVRAKERDELYGVEGNQEGLLMSELTFQCQDDLPPKPLKLPPRPSAAPSAGGELSPRPLRRVCIPGSTQRCVGVGACVGGQACDTSGTSWGPCECAPLPGSPAGLADAGMADGGMADGGTTKSPGAPQTTRAR